MAYTNPNQTPPVVTPPPAPAPANNFFKTGFILLLFLLVILLGFIAYYFYTASQKNINPGPISASPVAASEIPVISPSPLAPSAVPSPTVSPSPSVLPLVSTKSDAEIIAELFAKKYNHSAADAQVTISKNDGTHIWGGISFTGEMGGGWFLAAKVNGSWVIVQDGNGTISCETIAPYNFSVAMVPECVNAKGDLVKRS